MPMVTSPSLSLMNSYLCESSSNFLQLSSVLSLIRWHQNQGAQISGIQFQGPIKYTVLLFIL